MQDQRFKFYSILKLSALLLVFQTCSITSMPIEEPGLLYIWKDGDTLQKVSEKYGLSVMQIKQANEIYSEGDLVANTPIFIPGSYNIPSVSPNDDAPTNNGTRPLPPVVSSPVPPQDQTQPIQSFIWPSPGAISSPFGPRNGRPHEGVDIRADKGRTIVATATGKVVFSGKRNGFGNVVIIKHSEKIKTLYAHNKSNFVKVGQEINKGQRIAEMGNTGNSTGVHLHFEIHVGNNVVNPLNFMPPKSRH